MNLKLCHHFPCSKATTYQEMHGNRARTFRFRHRSRLATLRGGGKAMFLAPASCRLQQGRTRVAPGGCARAARTARGSAHRECCSHFRQTAADGRDSRRRISGCWRLERALCVPRAPRLPCRPSRRRAAPSSRSIEVAPSASRS